MKIIAVRGDNYYLVQTGGGKGYICRGKPRKQFPEQDIESILARGYWRPYDASLKKRV